MIVLFTDFGTGGPYTGQVQAVLARSAPGVPAVDLMSDLPPFRPRGAAHLLAALAGGFPADSVFLCVVDPGVGTVERAPVVYRVDGRWFVGPDNGLFDVVRGRGEATERWEISWRPAALSSTFHGRDLFAPVAAAIAAGEAPDSMLTLSPAADAGRPDDLAEAIYVDRYGNVMTGIRGEALPLDHRLVANGARFDPARTFGDVARGTPLWYVNSCGLVELAVNQGSAAERYGLEVGTSIEVC